MTISVIIPLFNGAQFIEQALKSVLRQSKAPNEIWVVDDGSTDDGKHVVSQYSQVTLINNHGKGPAAARNTAVELAHGSLIAFLDQDDVWHPLHLQRASDFLRDNPQAAFVYSAQKRFTSGAPEFEPPDNRCEWVDPWLRLPSCPVSSPSCVVVQRDALLQAGAWRPDVHSADLYSYLRLAARVPAAHLLSPTVAYRKSEASNSNRLRRDPVTHLRRQCASAQQAMTDAPVPRHDSIEIRARIDVLGMLEHFSAPNSAGFARLLEHFALHPELISDAVSHALWIFGPSWRNAAHAPLHHALSKISARHPCRQQLQQLLGGFMPMRMLLTPNLRFGTHRSGWRAVVESLATRLKKKLR